LGTFGRLGYGNEENVGDDETPASGAIADIGATVIELDGGGGKTCARLATAGVRCWGHGGHGQLGYAHTEDIGDDEPPRAAGDVRIGGTIVELSAGGSHACVRLDTGAIRCWGFGLNGQLGYGNAESIGDDELPNDAGDVPLF
jgi:alpha-tubulin suppressor-like RCC1 family protein